MTKAYKGGYTKGAANNRAVLRAEQVVEIFLSPEKYTYLADLYQVSVACISNIKRRHTWRHITVDIATQVGRMERPHKGKQVKGNKNGT